ncbi:MAG: fumarylacetoacetate hydrolase family protein [Ignavibacteria bacterium]|nr:fumarylacetoacetate hydrolase family protein [Ignavibacteria bacterium]
MKEALNREWNFTDGSSIPVGTMYGVGRNYAAHAVEMGGTVPTDPIIFIKPPSAYCKSNSTIELPNWSTDVHHELELVVVIGTDAEQVSEADAFSLVAGIGVGLDLTARDVQARAKKKGEPWAIAKGWKSSAPVSAIVPTSVCGMGPWDIALFTNNEIRQQANTSQMERSVSQLIHYLCSVFTLRKGDCIFTGTPSGVAAVHSGDVVTATLDELTSLTVRFT